MRAIYAFLFVLIINSCVKPACDEVYVISGQVMNGTTGEVAANQPLEISVSKADLFNPGYEILTTGKTDDEGKFNLSYKCSKITDGKVKIVSDFFIFENLPVNQNINKTFYISSKGKLKLVLKTNNPLETNNDTLFIAYGISTSNSSFTFEPFTNSSDIKPIILHVPVPTITIYYGRGANEFPYDKNIDRFKIRPKGGEYKVTGDPVIDEVTIEY